MDASRLPRHWPFQALVSGIPTMVWALTEGQGRDGIPHPEPRGQAAAEQPRHRRNCCPCGRSRPVGGQAPWTEALGQGRRLEGAPRLGHREGWVAGGQAAEPRVALALTFKDCAQECRLIPQQGSPLCGPWSQRVWERKGSLHAGCQGWESPPPPLTGKGHFPMELGRGLAAFLEDWSLDPRRGPPVRTHGGQSRRAVGGPGPRLFSAAQGWTNPKQHF